MKLICNIGNLCKTSWIASIALYIFFKCYNGEIIYTSSCNQPRVGN